MTPARDRSPYLSPWLRCCHAKCFRQFVMTYRRELCVLRSAVAAAAAVASDAILSFLYSNFTIFHLEHLLYPYRIYQLK